MRSAEDRREPQTNLTFRLPVWVKEELIRRAKQRSEETGTTVSLSRVVLDLVLSAVTDPANTPSSSPDSIDFAESTYVVARFNQAILVRLFGDNETARKILEGVRREIEQQKQVLLSQRRGENG